MEFVSGAEVEVCSDEEGFAGAYFEATMVRSQPKLGRYTVSYLSLESDRGGPLRETVEARLVRPRPPPEWEWSELHEYECVDAFHKDAWWCGVMLEDALLPLPNANANANTNTNRKRGEDEEEKEQVRVCFPLHREVLSFPRSLLRPHLEWHSDRWVPPSLLDLPPSIFPEGSKVEVFQLKQPQPQGEVEGEVEGEVSSVCAWFPAVVSKRIWKDNYLVSYSSPITAMTEPETEIVHLKHLRPPPCRSSAVSFYVNDHVEAFYGCGWWPATVLSTSQAPKYALHLSAFNKEMQFDQLHVRPCFDWINGTWLPSPRTYTHPKHEFHKGMLVEVSSDEDGFKGAWFAATIIRPVGTSFSVEYHHLRTDDEAALLQETVHRIHIRPVPPQPHCTPHPLRLLEEVDAYYNDGWWVGVVSKVLGVNRYAVYFRQWKEEMEFKHDELRPHFDWVGGRWIRASVALEL